MEAIHCETQEEFDRLLNFFDLDKEFMNWDFYKQDTVLYPKSNQYGSINGVYLEENIQVTKSTEIS